RSRKKPDDIPNALHMVYKSEGWTSWGDWLGTGTVAPWLRKWRPFKQAREFVRSLGLKNQAEWRAYVRSGRKPSDIPSNAHLVYKHDGWEGYADWFGRRALAGGQRKATAAGPGGPNAA